MTFCHPWILKIMVVGAGFLGKYISKALLYSEHDVTVIDKLDKLNPDRVKNHPLMADYEDNPRLNVILWEGIEDNVDISKNVKDYDVIIYTAAVTDMRNLDYMIEVNVKQTATFMEMLRLSGFSGRLIMLSSDAVYGHQPDDQLPTKEDATLNPVNIYGRSKVEQENLALTYHKNYGIKAVVIRSSAMYGPYSRSTQAMSIFIGQALRGEDFTLDGDGSSTRDFNYIMNMVDAIGLVLGKQGIEGEVFNIASGKEITLKALVGAIQTLFGPFSENCKVINKPWREGEKGLRVALDITKAQDVLGYAPQVPVLMGIKYMASWYAADVLRWDKKDMDALMSVFGFPRGQHIKRIGETIVRVVDEKPEKAKKVHPPMV